MERDVMILYMIAIISFSFAIFNAIFFLVKRGKTVKTHGRIVSLKSTNPTNERWRNAKSAIVSYSADGRNIVSKNRIQVSSAAQIGTPVTIRYDRNQPERIYGCSGRRIIAGVLIGAGSLLMAVFM